MEDFKSFWAGHETGTKSQERLPGFLIQDVAVYSNGEKKNPRKGPGLAIPKVAERKQRLPA